MRRMRVCPMKMMHRLSQVPSVRARMLLRCLFAPQPTTPTDAAPVATLPTPTHVASQPKFAPPSKDPIPRPHFRAASPRIAKSNDLRAPLRTPR